MKSYFTYIIVFFFTVLVFVPFSSAQAAQCTFTRTLELETTGEDVRCLQKFLNEQGFTVSESGVGSKGHETDQYKTKTKEAVKRWQNALGITPATGNFGSFSKAKYEASVSAPTSTPVPAQIEVSTPEPVVSQSSKQINKDLLNGLESIKHFEEYIDNEKDHHENVASEEKALKKARNYILDATVEFLKGKYENVSGYLDKAKSEVSKYQKDLNKSSDKTGAKKELDSIRKEIEAARKDIEDSKAKKTDISEAKNILDKAEKRYNNARNVYNDEDYTDVIDMVDEVRDLLNDVNDII